MRSRSYKSSLALIGAAVSQLRRIAADWTGLQSDLMRRPCPVPWSHIGITGDYLWNEIDRPLERFRPLRANHFNPKGFVFT